MIGRRVVVIVLTAAFVVAASLGLAARFKRPTERAGATGGRDFSGAQIGELGLGSSMALSTPHVDLGLVPAGGAKSETLTIRNVGQSPEHLARMTTSCACLAAEVSKNDIAAGESALIRLVLDLGPEDRFVGSLMIHVTGYNNRDQAILTFTVEATGANLGPGDSN
jgi:hypothetical protein